MTSKSESIKALRHRATEMKDEFGREIDKIIGGIDDSQALESGDDVIQGDRVDEYEKRLNSLKEELKNLKKLKKRQEKISKLEEKKVNVIKEINKTVSGGKRKKKHNKH